MIIASALSQCCAPGTWDRNATGVQLRRGSFVIVPLATGLCDLPTPGASRPIWARRPNRHVGGSHAHFHCAQTFGSR